MNLKIKNKIKGAVYGFAIGDAMGATTEFLTQEQIQRFYGVVTEIIGGGWLGIKPGEVTDDTQMTMCIMSAIMKEPETNDNFLKLCENNFIKWYNSRPKDIGNQCAKAIHYLVAGMTIPVDNNALGNGSLMRAMPLAIINNPTLNVLQGRITHNNRYCSKIILDYTSILQGYLNDDRTLINEAIMPYFDNGELQLQEPTGHVRNTFINSFIWSYRLDFENAILCAVNHGGDSDTIAAITGSLAGAKYGFENIPKRWVKALDPKVKFFLNKFVDYVCKY